MANRKRTLLVTLLVLMLIVGTFASLELEHQRELDRLRKSFDRICVGMSKADAESMIGRAADYIGDYGQGENEIGESWVIEGQRLDLRLARDTLIVLKKDLSPLDESRPFDWLRRLFRRK